MNDIIISNKHIKHTPTSKQLAFMSLKCEDAFFGGAAGGGKSDALLMAALMYVDKPNYSAIILRDSYANLSMEGALLSRADEWLGGTDARWLAEKKRWVFPSGASLSFGYLDGPRDHHNYQGAEFQFVGIDEVVNIRERQALYMFSRLRRLKNSDVPIRFRCASNPPTREQMSRGLWVKERYVNSATRKKGAIYIPSKLTDNPYLDQDSYRNSLMNLDPITRTQLLDGDWEIHAEGGFFQKAWFNLTDVIPHKDDIVNTVRFWDMAATESENACYTAGVKMHKTKIGTYYIDSVIKFKKTPRDSEALIRQTADMDGKNVSIRMELEGGSGGKITIDHYTRLVLQGFDFRGVKPKGKKSERAMPVASQAESGNIYLVRGAWLADFLDEMELFPEGFYKDQVDATSGAFDFLAADSIMNIHVF